MTHINRVVGLNEEKKSTVIFRDTPNEAHRYVRYQQVQGSGQNGQNSHTSGVPTFLLAIELGPFCLRFCLVIVLFSAARYCNLTQIVAERGLNASEVKTGEFMSQSLDQGLALFHGFCACLPCHHPSGCQHQPGKDRYGVTRLPRVRYPLSLSLR